MIQSCKMPKRISIVKLDPETEVVGAAIWQAVVGSSGDKSPSPSSPALICWRPAIDLSPIDRSRVRRATPKQQPSSRRFLLRECYGHVSCAVPVTWHSPAPPQGFAGIIPAAPQESPPLSATAQTVYVPTAPAAHWATPSALTETAVVRWS